MRKNNKITQRNRPMSDMDLQRVTGSLSYIGQASESTSLTLKEEAFCIAVLSGQNPSDAYRAAYRPQRAKPKTVHEMASRLMAKHKVRTRLAELMQPVIDRAQLSREQWLDRLARICLADVRRMFDSCGNPLPVTGLEPNEAAAIAACEVFSNTKSSDELQPRGRTIRVRMVDQLRALELYGKAMGYFDKRGEITGAPEDRRCITVEFVAAGNQPPHLDKDTPVPQTPSSMTACGRSPLTY